MASKVKWNINLKSNIKKAFDGKSSEFIARAYQKLNERDVKKVIGERVIERVVERTLDSKDKNNKKFENFAPYSSSYKKSFEFKVYGKTSKVNLLLTGEMLNGMRATPIDGGVIIDFYDDQNDKAHGHIHGIKSKKGKVVRDFFGLPQDELNKIIKDAITITDAELTLNKIENNVSELIADNMSEGLDDEF